MQPNSAKHAAVLEAAQHCKNLAGLARALNISIPAVLQWVNGDRRVPMQRCLQIEQITGGAVRCEQLRPDIDWSALRGVQGAVSELA